MIKTICSFILVFLLFGIGMAQSRLKVTAQERKEIFQMIVANDAEIKQEIEQNGAVIADLEAGMKVEKSDINGDRQPEYFVEIYSGGLCGALANCPDWVYQKNGNSYRLLLRTFGRELTAARTSTNNYRDLRSTGGDTAERDAFSIYKFDGTKYRAKNCYSRIFANGTKTEKIIPIKCVDN
jgi:hypothetical protein